MLELRVGRRAPYPTPLGAAGRGMLAGLGASLMLSGLARVLPGMGNRPQKEGGGKAPSPPRDPFDPAQVRDWQARGQAPAAFEQQAGGSGSPGGSGGSGGAEPSGSRQQEAPPHPAASPGGALAQPVAPGPEGLAEQFAFKIASGVFGVDVTPQLVPAGIATHLAYGSAWGALYGLTQGTLRQPPLYAGFLFGLLVWLFGPAILVPLMKLMRAPHQEPPLRTAMLIAGHAAYGIVVACTYDLLERKTP